MRRLIDFRGGGVEKTFLVPCGRFTGAEMVVKRHDAFLPYLELDSLAQERYKFYSEKYTKLLQCGSHNVVQNLKCVRGDPFTIKTILMWVVYKIFTDAGIPHIVKVYSAFVCGDFGHNVHETSKPISLLFKDKKYLTAGKRPCLKYNILETMLSQAVAIIEVLSAFSFSCGSTFADSISFSEEPVSYAYEGMHVRGPITLKIENMHNASITVQGTRYLPKSKRDEIYIGRDNFEPEVSTTPRKNQEGVFDLCYRITTNSLETYKTMRVVGFPLYSGSFEFYSLLLAFMCNKTFFDSMMKTPKSRSIWEQLWTEDQIQLVEKSLEKVHNGEITCPPIDLVRGIWLKCNVLEIVHSALSKKK